MECGSAPTYAEPLRVSTTAYRGEVLGRNCPRGAARRRWEDGQSRTLLQGGVFQADEHFRPRGHPFGRSLDRRCESSAQVASRSEAVGRRSGSIAPIDQIARKRTFPTAAKGRKRKFSLLQPASWRQRRTCLRLEQEVFPAPSDRRRDPLDFDVLFMRTSFGEFVRSLHPQHRVGTHAERLLEPDRHLGR